MLPDARPFEFGWCPWEWCCCWWRRPIEVPIRVFRLSILSLRDSLSLRGLECRELWLFWLIADPFGVWSPSRSRTGRMTGEMSIFREVFLLPFPFFDGEPEDLLWLLSDGHTPLNGLLRMISPYVRLLGPSLTWPLSRVCRKVPIGIRSQRLRFWRWRLPSSVALASGSPMIL